jgi:hypothetical protein
MSSRKNIRADDPWDDRIGLCLGVLSIGLLAGTIALVLWIPWR